MLRGSESGHNQRAAASAWARLMSDGTKSGRPRSALDMIIAAIAEANDCVVVTENERDFAGLTFFHPLAG